jgi:hypothetical protein
MPEQSLRSSQFLDGSSAREFPFAPASTAMRDVERRPELSEAVMAMEEVVVVG